jgi:hypothetical protein
MHYRWGDLNPRLLVHSLEYSVGKDQGRNTWNATDWEQRIRETYGQQGMLVS